MVASSLLMCTDSYIAIDPLLFLLSGCPAPDRSCTAGVLAWQSGESSVSRRAFKQ